MTIVTITREELLSREPCEDSGGVELFDSICELAGARDALQVIDWTPLHSLWLAVQCPDKYFWLWAEGLIPDMLRGANLIGADLRGANLGEAHIHRADLREASLREAYLHRANLYGANLCGADLSGANLRGADLRRADLSWANLHEADLRRADLYGADLSGAYRPDNPPPGWEPDDAGYLRRVDESEAATPGVEP